MTTPTPPTDAPSRLTVDGYTLTLPGDGGAESRAIHEATRSVDYVCSTESLDSHGTILRQNWRLDRYARNPVVLFCHDSRSIPVGTASMVRVENGRLMARVTFATEEVSEDAEECWRAVKAGLLRGISVGFLAHAYRWEMQDDKEHLVLDDLELLELSVCAVPSNPDTLAQRDALSTLRATAHAQRSQRPAQDTPPMTEQELKALRDALAAREADVARLSADSTARAADLAAARAAADKAAADLAERSAKVDLLTAEAERLGQRLADAEARATAAEDKLLRQDVESLVGRSVDPAEVDHLVALRKAAPALFDAEMARRKASGRNDALTAQVIPSDAPGQRSAGVDPIADLNQALARHLPKG